MPNLSEEIRLKCEEALGIPVLKVKWTDKPNVGLALTGEGTGVWIDLNTWEETKPATIFQEVITVLKPELKQKKEAEPAESTESESAEPAAEEPVTNENGIEQSELDKLARSKRTTKPKTSKPKATRKKKGPATQ